MNNFHSEALLYYRRWLTPQLQAACEAHPVVVLTGARQVGKSTLLRRAEPFSGWRYHTMDDFDALRQPLRQAIMRRAGAHEVIPALGPEFVTMRRDGLLKAAQGLTTVDEVLRATQDASDEAAGAGG